MFRRDSVVVPLAAGRLRGDHGLPHHVEDDLVGVVAEFAASGCAPRPGRAPRSAVSRHEEFTGSAYAGGMPKSRR